MLTLTFALVCSLSAALTSLLVSTRFGLPLIVTLVLVLFAAPATKGVATAECARPATQQGLPISAAISIQRADFIGPWKFFTEVINGEQSEGCSSESTF